MSKKTAIFFLLGVLSSASALGETPKTSRYDLSPDEITDVENSVRDVLKDPDSAKFKGLRAQIFADGRIEYCGYVNSKNSMGGYVGFAPVLGDNGGPGHTFHLITLGQTPGMIAQLISHCDEMSSGNQ